MHCFTVTSPYTIARVSLWKHSPRARMPPASQAGRRYKTPWRAGWGPTLSFAKLRRVLTPGVSYRTRLSPRAAHSTVLLASGPPALTLSLPVPGALPATATPGGFCTRTPLSLAARQNRCLNASRKEGRKGRRRARTKWGTRESVGGLRPGAPRESAPAGLALAPPGPPGCGAKAGPYTHPAFCAKATQRRGKKTRLPF